MGVQPSLEADAQFAEARKPRMGTLDDPTMSAQFLAAFDTTTGNARQDATALEMFTATTEVMTFISM